MKYEEIIEKSVAQAISDNIGSLIVKQIESHVICYSSMDGVKPITEIIDDARTLRKIIGKSKDDIYAHVTFDNFSDFIDDASRFHIMNCQLLFRSMEFKDNQFKQKPEFSDIEKYIENQDLKTGHSYKLNLIGIDFIEENVPVKILEISKESLICVTLDPRGPYDARIEDDIKYELTAPTLYGMSNENL